MTCYETELHRRIMQRVMFIDTGYITPCWSVQGWNTGNGYAKIRVNGRGLVVHRVLYKLLIGDVPDELLLDHLCKHRPCANPLHLEPVTDKVNTQRGDAVLFGDVQCLI